MSMNADGKWPRRARSYKFWCVDIRWRLCRRLFAVPLPLSTTYLDLKLCDVLITLPFVGMLFGYAAQSALQGEVAASGWPPPTGLSLTIASVVRNNSLLLALTGISFEGVLYYHKLFAVVTVLLVVLHCWSYLRLDNYDDQVTMRSKVVSGLIAFVAMVLLLLLSLSVVRRKLFEFFVRAHWLLFGIVIVYVVVHGVTLVLLGVTPWAIDVVYRFVYRTRVYSHGSPTRTEIAEDSLKRVQRGVASRGQVWMVKVAEDMLRVQFRRERVDTDESFEHRAGQCVLVCVPMVSILEWHPFTISSSPTEVTVTMHIKVVGDWTRSLLRLAENDEISSKVSVDILMDGPYGGVSIDIYRPDTYSHFVLLSEGVGVMPMRSAVTWLYHNFQTQSRDDIKRVHFVWSIHNQHEMNTLLDENTLENDSDAFFVTDLQQKSNIQHEIRDRFVFDLYVAQSELDVHFKTPASALTTELSQIFKGFYGISETRPNVTPETELLFGMWVQLP